MREHKHDLNELTAIYPGDGRYWGLTEELCPFMSEAGLVSIRIELEARYLIALSKVGAIRPLNADEEKFLMGLTQNFDIEKVRDVKEIEETTKHDVKAIEKLFAKLFFGNSMEDLTCMVHILLTSEDINNLAYRIMYSRALKEVYIPALEDLVDVLTDKAREWQKIALLGLTHGQPAIPTTLGKEIVNFAIRIDAQVGKLKAQKLKGKLNGAIGNYNSFYVAHPQVDWLEFSSQFVANWGFEVDYFTTQINPFDDLVESFQTLQRINSIMIGFNQDMWRYISDNIFVQTKKPGEIGSSVMTQKINPIFFENGEGNFKIANGIWEVLCRELLISRLQRDLVNSTEVRNVGPGLASGLIAIKNTINAIGRINPNHEQLDADLNKNWNILGEVIQTVLRSEKVPDAYALVEKFTKGMSLSESQYKVRVSELPISGAAKSRLLALSPQTYVGKASDLVDKAIAQIRFGR